MRRFSDEYSDAETGERGHFGDMLLGGMIGLALGVALNPARKLAIQGAGASKGDWFQILKAEHRAVERMFDRLTPTQPDEVTKRQLLLTQIAYALNKHAITEENVVYPALRAQNPDAAMKLGREHLDIKALISRLQYDVEKFDSAWIEYARELRDLVVAHAQEEEVEILAAFHSRLSDSENASLTRRLHWEGFKVV